ncbi:MAG TPA: VTT domain-containing protein [Thermoplasmata archaeon]|nr:VTT domain-containing protein [Thermoplasmata archaeon]
MVDLFALLVSLGHDPVAYSALFFLFAVATAVFLPFPVELGLINSSVNPVVLALVLGLGKALGSVLVFRLGARVEEGIDKWIVRYPAVKPWLDRLERFVAKHGYWALFVLLSIPFMTDTVPLYLFSVLNPSVKDAAAGKNGGAHGAEVSEAPGKTRPKHALSLAPFILVNFAAGVVRAAIFISFGRALGWY